MFAGDLNTRLLATLERPDLRVVADRQRIVFDASLDTPFRADPAGEVVLGAACLGPERICAFHIRHALELSMLLDAATRYPGTGADGVGSHDLPILAGLIAARTASRFWLLDAAPDDEPPPPDPASWLAAMASATMPSAAALRTVWGRVRNLQGESYRLLRTVHVGQDDSAVPEPVLRRLAACWSLLGPAETLMAEGGDARLAVDPRTGLNHYGCSHRPRPWAITFASSTASSLSERGFGGAETARKRLAAAALGGTAQAALEAESDAVRAALAAHYGLAPGEAVMLAASGTDSELAALAVCLLPGPDGLAPAPVSSILLAPEETGAGVPLAASGRHFAGDTASRRQVSKGALLEGFPETTRVLSVPIRDAEGRLRSPDDVDADCVRIASAEAAAGRTVLLHCLDVSKTGVLAPGATCLDRLQARLGGRMQVAVDACQARLDRRRVQDYLARDCMVMITGSKFFTGPPFCGALLLPGALAARLQGPGRLPPGLGDYGGSPDWPTAAPAASGLGRVGNIGLLLRWQAALAEMHAFAQVPDQLARHYAESFLDGVRQAIAASADLVAVEVGPPMRPSLPSGWDQLQTICSFLVLEPGGTPCAAARRPLDVARARQVYRWLNADVSRALPADADPEEHALARLLCHVGQPAPVAHDLLQGEMAGALRISVGARLLSGEPSHEGSQNPARLRREIADVRRILDKISLLLQHWPVLEQLDPEPRFASDRPLRRRADPGLNI